MLLEARNTINPAFRSESLDTLTLHEKLTLLAICYSAQEASNGKVHTEPAYVNYQIKCGEYFIDPQVIITFRKYIRKLVALKIISVTWLNPTVAKKGQQMEIFFTDIDPRQLAAYLEKQFKGPKPK